MAARSASSHSILSASASGYQMGDLPSPPGPSPAMREKGVLLSPKRLLTPLNIYSNKSQVPLCQRPNKKGIRNPVELSALRRSFGTQLHAPFVGRDVGSRRRTRQGTHGRERPSRSNLKKTSGFVRVEAHAEREFALPREISLNSIPDHLVAYQAIDWESLCGLGIKQTRGAEELAPWGRLGADL